MGWLNKVFGGASDTASVSDPSSPEYVPTPKAKVAGAAHPIVKDKASRPRGRATGVGIVYDAAGRPKITTDWLKNLPADERPAVDANLAAHGWKISADSTQVEKI